MTHSTQELTNIEEYLADFQVHKDEALALIARTRKEGARQRHAESHRGVMLRMRDSESRRALLDTRENGVLEHPMFMRGQLQIRF